MRQAHVEGLHSVELGALLHRLVERGLLALLDQLATWGAPIRISCTATRPGRSVRLSRRCTIATRVMASILRICRCCAGEAVQDAVDGLLGVVGVQRREDQVTGLGGVDADVMDSLSRISPMRMTSGSSRMAARSAVLKSRVSNATSR